MRGKLETIVGAMFAGKTSELLKRILWAKHQQKNILVLKPSIDDRFSNKLIVTHNNLSHECYAMRSWNDASETLNVTKELVRRGYTKTEIEKLWSGNLLRVLDEVQAVAQKIQQEE